KTPPHTGRKKKGIWPERDCDAPRPNPVLRSRLRFVSRLCAYSLHADADRLVLFASVDRARFRRDALLSLRAERSQIPPVAVQQPGLYALDTLVRSRPRPGIGRRFGKEHPLQLSAPRRFFFPSGA